MFEGVKNGAGLISASFKTFRQYPILALPIFVVWLIYAPLIIYFKWDFKWDMYNNKAQFMILFLIIYFLAFILSISCSVMLELLQQKETGKKLNLAKALLITFSYNLVPIMLLSFVWSFIWFILVVIKIFIKDKSSQSEEKSAENVARTLAGTNDSFGTFSIDLLLKGIRMVVFLIIPAFAWENKGIRQSFRRGFQILGERKSEFLGGFSLSLAMEFIIFLPAGIMFYLSNKGMEFPDWSWFICIFYVGLAWSYSIYLEQMFAAELYLWQMTYEKEVEIWTSKKKKLKGFKDEYPDFGKIRRPSIIDNIPDLNP
ncbi:hypothetical protein AB8P51_14990 [Muriicola sp. SD30]|uniref:hypothetical protein n=1 Tax=Muriicola sp. SD30 TaxID=3240936 RepID=UPI003510D128